MDACGTVFPDLIDGLGHQDDLADEVALARPMKLRDLTIRNRLWLSPMCQYSVIAQDGVPGTWHVVHLGGFAAGGAGLVMAESTAVSPEGRITPRDTGIWNNTQRDRWSAVVGTIHELGAAAGIQLNHAGRKGSDRPTWGWPGTGALTPDQGGWPTVSASALSVPGLTTPSMLDSRGIDRVVKDFWSSARRAAESGFDVIEIQAGHGYLLHQFLSPLSNHRKDSWGGCLENRSRLLDEVVDAVRDAIGDRVLFVRLSATDHLDGGLEVNDVGQVSAALASRGVDLIDVTTAGLLPVHIGETSGYQVPYATRIRQISSLPVSAVGVIGGARLAEEVVADERADAVMIGRAMLRDPAFAIHVLHELHVEDLPWPPQYNRAYR